MSKLIISPAIFRPTPVEGIWSKSRSYLLKQDDGSLVKIGEKLEQFYEHVIDEAGDADDQVTTCESKSAGAEFVVKIQRIRYLFKDELESLKGKIK